MNKFLNLIATASLAYGCISCSGESNQTANLEPVDTLTTENTKVQAEEIAVPEDSEYTANELKILKQGLVDISKLDSTIAVHLVYATPYNFTGHQLYEGITHAFMLPVTAEMLIKANKLLKRERPDLSIIIYDAARPISVQKKMWNFVKGTYMHSYVSDPSYGIGMHNFGAAVDVSLIDCTQTPIPMGGTYDYFGDESKIYMEQELLKKGRITQRELDYRLLLRKVMTKAGFHTFKNEWWHFDIMRPRNAKGKFKVIQ